MKVRLNPLAAQKQEAEDRVNSVFNRIAFLNVHRDMAHQRKREEARKVLQENEHQPVFAAEAKRTGKSIQELATVILDKPDEFAEREDKRRLMIEQIRSATSEDVIADVLSTIGADNGA